MNEKRLFYYQGPVTQFGKMVIHSNWYGATKAVSKAKAYSNLIYQFKKQYDMQPWTKIELSRNKIFTEEELYESYGQMAFTEQELYSTSN